MINWNEVEVKIQSIIISKGQIEELKKKQPEEVKSISENIKQLHEIAPIWTGFSDKVYLKLKLSQEERSLWNLVNILVYTEGPLNIIINYIVYSLMLKGNKIKIRCECRFADSYNDLFKIDLNGKLAFLKKKECGFKFVSKICPREIRNAMAHMRFKIKPDGTVIILTTGREFKTEDLDEILINIREFIIKFKNSLTT